MEDENGPTSWLVRVLEWFIKDGPFGKQPTDADINSCVLYIDGGDHVRDLLEMREINNSAIIPCACADPSRSKRKSKVNW